MAQPTKVDAFLMSIYNTSTVKQRFSGTQFVDRPYIEMVQDTPYLDIMDDPEQRYSVYLDKSNLHWFVLVQKTDSTLPYITLEISTLNMVDLLTVMKVMGEKDCKKLTHIGNYTGKLSKFCIMADRIRETMGQYQLLLNNCQHFCNNLAYQFGMRIQNPSGTFLLNVPAVTILEKMPDKVAEESEPTEVVYHQQVGSFRRAPMVVQKNAAKAVAIITGVKGYDDIVHQVEGHSERLV